MMKAITVQLIQSNAEPQYGSYGIVAFVVNYQGKIYQKDMGPKTAVIVDKRKEYNPDSTWEPFLTPKYERVQRGVMRTASWPIEMDSWQGIEAFAINILPWNLT